MSYFDVKADTVYNMIYQMIFFPQLETQIGRFNFKGIRTKNKSTIVPTCTIMMMNALSTRGIIVNRTFLSSRSDSRNRR